MLYTSLANTYASYNFVDNIIIPRTEALSRTRKPSSLWTMYRSLHENDRKDTGWEPLEKIRIDKWNWTEVVHFCPNTKNNRHHLGLSAQNMEFSVKYFEIDTMHTSDPKSRNSVAVSYFCLTLRFNEVSIHLCRLEFMSVLPSHAPSNLVAEEHLHPLVIYSRFVICLYEYIDVDMDWSSSSARLFDTSTFMRIINFIINGHPTSGLAIYRWGRDTFSDQIRFPKPFFSDAPSRNVLTGVSALRDLITHGFCQILSDNPEHPCSTGTIQ